MSGEVNLHFLCHTVLCDLCNNNNFYLCFIGLPGLPANRRLLRTTGGRVRRPLRRLQAVPLRVQPRDPVLPGAQGHEGEGDEPGKTSAGQFHAQEDEAALLQQIRLNKGYSAETLGRTPN